MILLHQSKVSIFGPDGTCRIFEPSDLSSKLVTSFLSCGAGDPWIAEDISLAVESGLLENSTDPVLTETELNDWVVKILNELGFSDVAAHFDSIHDSIKRIPCDTAALRDLLHRQLDLSDEELERAAVRASRACKLLNLETVTPSLAVELARNYIPNPTRTGKLPRMPFPNSGENCIADRAEILGLTSEKTQFLATRNILNPSPVSNLFPAVKLNLRFANFADMLCLSAPTTELALIPHYRILGDAALDILGVCEKLTAESTESSESVVPLPFCLRLADISYFARSYLHVETELSEMELHELVSPLTDIVGRDARILF